MMTKKDDKNFGSSTKCLICDNAFVDSNLKVSYHCHVTGKYKDSVHRDCNIKLKLNHKIPILFQNLNYGIHLIIEEPLTLK